MSAQRLIALPDEIIVPNRGNNVIAFAEDMRFSRNVIQFDKYHREIGEKKVHPIVWEARNSNLVMDYGRQSLLWTQFVTGSPTVKFLFGSVGNSASTPTDHTLNALVGELTGNAARVGITDISGGTLVTGDITSETSGSNFWKIVTQFIYDVSDLNNGATFAEFGMHDNTTFATGNMFARFCPTSSFVKTSAFRVTVQWTVRS